MNNIAVQCKGVTKTYGSGNTQVHALRGVDLEVYPGEFMLLVGPSGSGKTTLISIIAGVLDADGGECLVFDHDFKPMNRHEKTRYRGQSVGFVFQMFNLIPTLSAAENVAVPLLIHGTKRRAAIDRAREILDRVGLGDRTYSLPAELSGGQQQRVAIARSIVHNPKLIVCDDPPSALDHETGHKVMEMLREVATGADRVLIVVTHDARIFEFADRIAKMDDGQVTLVTSPLHHLQEKKEIRKVFMIGKYLLPVLAIFGIGFAVLTVVKGSKTIPPAQPVVDPAAPPFKSSVAGTGIVEANTENIAIGTLVPGVVSEIYVSVGSEVKAGDPLFKLDDRDLKAQRAVRQTALRVAEASVKVEKASLADLKNQLERAEILCNKQVISVDELDRRRYAVQIAGAKLSHARAEVLSVKAQIRETETNLERIIVRAPIDGEVLQLKIHVGEYEPARND